MAVIAFIRRHPLWTVGLLAALLRATFALLTHPDPMNGVDSLEYDGIARALLAGKGMTTDVGFVRPPLYPIYLAFCYAIGGFAVVLVTQILMGAATAVLVGLLGRELFSDDRAAWMGALLAAVYPWFFQYVGTIASENLFTLLAVASFVAILRAAKTRSGSGALRVGALLSLASLARANLLVLAPGVALWWWWQGRRFVPAFLFGVGILIALVPFTAYNVASGNGPVVGSSGGGLSFYIGNNADTARFYGGGLSDDEWRALSKASILGPQALRDAGCDPAAGQGACIHGMPISQTESFWYGAGFHYITTHPGDWALLEWRKLAHYWRPWVDPRSYPTSIVIVSGLSFGALLIVSIVGLLMMGRRNALLVLAVAAGSTIAAVVWNVQLRYRFALLDPVLIAASALPAAILLERLIALGQAARPEARTVPTS